MADPDHREDDAARRAYGVLATGLGEALGETRDVFAEHAALLPEGRLDEFDVLVQEFEERRVRVALYGEVKAGKSTLINALSGRELSPSAFDPLTSLPVRITYGAETTWRVGEQTFERVDEVERLMRLGTPDADEIVVETPNDLLRLGGQVDLLDTPGVGSDDRSDQISEEVLSSLDAVVLVVRYPALFTKVTRQIMGELENDIGKLFVVWNLDADCAELSTEERMRHANRLRADVAGAHELYLVDARAGLRARAASDEEGVVESGLDELVSALGAFASSDKRQVTALREAAKRADRWFEDGDRALSQRRDHLRIKLEEVRGRLSDLEKRAQAEEKAVQDQFEHFQSTLDTVERDREAGMRRCAAFLRRSIRASRRAWAKSGELEPLRSQLAAAADAYENGVQSVNRDFSLALSRAASEFGSEFANDIPRGVILSPEPLAPEDRIEHSRQGRGQWLRRVLWRRWFLPGVAAMERDGLDADVARHAQWADSVRATASAAMREVLRERSEEIVARRDAEIARVKEESHFEEESVELASLEEHVPLMSARRKEVAEINRRAWDLVGDQSG